VTPPVALPGNKIAFAVVTGVTPSRPSTLDEVRAQIRNTIVEEKLNDVVTKKANELAELAKSTGDLKKAAQSMKLEFKAPDAFTRSGAVEGLGTAAYLEGAFTNAVGTVLGPLSVPDGRAVVKVVGHTPADMAELAAQRAAIRDDLKSRKSRDRTQLFEAGLRQSLIQKGKIKIHQDVINRMAAGYRGGGA
jgi:parvulin-like peptidyl-prolyl isomerase